jgi:hypothetical protein
VALGLAISRTPIIESRVTKPCNSASVHPRVPVGRIGKTMYRRSAVESCTRICNVHSRLTSTDNLVLILVLTLASRRPLLAATNRGMEEEGYLHVGRQSSSEFGQD